MGLRDAVSAAAGAIAARLPGSATRERYEDRIQRQLDRVPTQLNEYGYDPWGLYPAAIATYAAPVLWLYEHYFRVETFGVETLPPGRQLLVSNHAGQLPFDALMIACALLMEAEPPRIARGMTEYWVSELPFLGLAAARGGGVSGTRRTCREMLEDGEAVLAFPEGVRGMNKLYAERYQLQRFGTGFVSLALETESPIVPIAVVGSEEQQPGIANWESGARLLGTPSFPLTPTFPWLGPLGLLPMPVRYRIYFGEAIHLAGDDDPETIDAGVERVREAIDSMLTRGRGDRSGVFF